jgi:hypothetical protein
MPIVATKSHEDGLARVPIIAYTTSPAKADSNRVQSAGPREQIGTAGFSGHLFNKENGPMVRQTSTLCRSIRRLLARLAPAVAMALAATASAPGQSPPEAGGGDPAGQQDGRSPSVKVSLQDRLEAGLKARRPSEFAFIAQVVAAVDAGLLPRSLVDSTFLWARRKRPQPFFFFERGLRLRAARRGIRLN